MIRFIMIFVSFICGIVLSNITEDYPIIHDTLGALLLTTIIFLMVIVIKSKGSDKHGN